MPQRLQFTLLSKHISLHMSLDHWVRTAPLHLYADFFFNKYTLSPPYHHEVSHPRYNHVSKTLFLIMDAEGWLYELFYPILHKGPEHCQVLVSAGVPESIPQPVDGYS